MEQERRALRTSDGWELELSRAATGGAPVLFVHGYGMNSSVFWSHPSGRSFAAVLAEAGLEPWSLDLRGTKSSRRGPGAPRETLTDQAFVDLPEALATIRRATGAARVHVLGCSLGGSLVYAAAAKDCSAFDRLVGIGAPLDWGRSTQVRVLSALLPIGGRWPMRGTRRLATVALPLAARFAPGLLRIYLNPEITDLSDVSALTRTVENPSPSVNRALGAWMREGSFAPGGFRVGQALAAMDRPLLVVHADSDGIVPPDAALSVVGRTGGPVEVERVEHPDGRPVGHADLFVADLAPDRVFGRVARFLVQG